MRGAPRAAKKNLQAASFLKLNRHVDIFSANFCGGQPHKGVALGPESLHSAGLLSAIEGQKWSAKSERINFSSLEPGLRQPSVEVSSAARAISEKVFASAQAGNFPLLLGGDHSVALGSVAGLLKARKDTRVLWVDARECTFVVFFTEVCESALTSNALRTPHTAPFSDADINTPAISPSGNFHGMPVAFLAKLFDPPKELTEWDWLKEVPPLPLSHIAYVGLRDVDEGERALLSAHGVLAFSMSEVDRLGIATVMKRALKHLLGGDCASPPPLHLSFDIDGVDPSVAPSTGTAVEGGLTYREAHYICEAAAASGSLCSMDLVEVNPELGTKEEREKGVTAKAGVALIASALGKTTLL